MRKKTKIILTLACASLCCLALGACKLETDLDKLDKKGYNDITVTFDANGGRFMSLPGISIVYKYDISQFWDADQDGKIQISLNGTDPAIATYKSLGKEKVIGVPAKTDYSFAGWYEKCNPRVNDNGEPLDYYDNVLEVREGTYYIKGTDTISEQAYNYYHKWDFAEDKIDYEIGSEPISVTLYAAWVPYYKFNFYYEEKGEWTLLDSQTFDYTRTQRFRDSDYGYEHAVKATVNNDYIWVPQWNGKDEDGNLTYTGAMDHNHMRSDNSTFTFPSLENHTFKAAYSDQNCVEGQEITELTHAGTLTYNKETQKLELNNVTQDIYVKFDEGVHYRIGSAKEFATYGAKANASSVYTIVANELDFAVEKVNWPAALTSMEFAGKIIGNNCTFKNVTATNGDTSVAYGGLFGTITASAVIKDITFENVTYDMATGTARGGSAYYGVFAGVIEAGASVSGITVINPTLQIGKLGRGDYNANLVCGNANGNEGITYSGARVVLVATKSGNRFLYFVKNVSVNEENGNVTFEVFVSSRDAEEKPTETYVAYSANNNSDIETEES